MTPNRANWRRKEKRKRKCIQKCHSEYWCIMLLFVVLRCVALVYSLCGGDSFMCADSVSARAVRKIGRGNCVDTMLVNAVRVGDAIRKYYVGCTTSRDQWIDVLRQLCSLWHSNTSVSLAIRQNPWQLYHFPLSIFYSQHGAFRNFFLSSSFVFHFDVACAHEQ